VPLLSGIVDELVEVVLPTWSSVQEVSASTSSSSTGGEFVGLFFD
jgi:hypothetical protein